MITEDKLHDDFMKDFRDLLLKYDAKFYIEYNYWDNTSEPNIDFNSQWSVSGEELRSYSQLKLQNNESGK